jgi:(2Fe-2S) ferredoxin
MMTLSGLRIPVIGLPFPPIDDHYSVLLINRQESGMKQQEAPYKCHLFVCVKSRGGERKSCGDGGNPELKAVLKDEIRSRGWKGMARISESSCLGVCDDGPNIMIYPQRIWLSDVSIDDVPEILNTVGAILAG